MLAKNWLTDNNGIIRCDTIDGAVQPRIETECSGVLTRTHGLPCAHALKQTVEEPDMKVELDLFDRQWRLASVAELERWTQDDPTDGEVAMTHDMDDKSMVSAIVGDSQNSSFISTPITIIRNLPLPLDVLPGSPMSSGTRTSLTLTPHRGRQPSRSRSHFVVGVFQPGQSRGS